MMWWLLLTSVNFPIMEAALTLNGKLCGTKYCTLHEYCSTFNRQCESCLNVCEDTSHNFDKEFCTSQCQDYLHDMRYARSARYEDDIAQLKQQQKLIMVLLIVLLILFVITYGLRFVKWIRNQDCVSSWILKKIKPFKKTPPTNTDITHENPHTESPKMQRSPIHIPIQRANSNVFSVSGVDGSTVQTVSTPVSTRYPAENSTTEYSYDNAGLQVTPVTEKPKGNETTF